MAKILNERRLGACLERLREPDVRARLAAAAAAGRRRTLGALHFRGAVGGVSGRGGPGRGVNKGRQRLEASRGRCCGAGIRAGLPRTPSPPRARPRPPPATQLPRPP